MNAQARVITTAGRVAEEPALTPPRAILQRKCACGTHTAGGGECRACAGKGGLLQRHTAARTGGLPSRATAADVLGALGHEQVGDARPGGELRMSRVPGRGEQSESDGLRVGPPGDAYEREADRIAEQVLGRDAGEVSAPSLRAASPPAVVRRRPSAEGARAAGPEEAAPVREVLRDGGRPLPPGVRDFFEPRFGHDFSGVRVHTDGRAAGSAEALGADAYTVGQHVVFGPRRFEPATPAGRRLLAHELSHVLQQTGGSPAAAPPSGVGAGLVQRHTSFSAAEQTAGTALGWKHPAGEALLVSDDGKMAVENKGWKNSKRVWAVDALITASNGILTSQGSRVRLKSGSGTISGKSPNAPAGTALTLNEVQVESAGGGPLKLTGDCGQACKEVMGSPTDPEESVAVSRNPQGMERYTPGRTYESRRTSASGLATTEEWSEDIFRMKFGAAGTRAETLKKYDDLSAANKKAFDREHGINKFAVPKVGQGVTISTEFDMPGFARNPGRSTWNFHFATAILASGDDYVSLENIARRADTAWFFWMYGPERKGQSFHEFQGAMKEHGTKFTTMVVQPEKLLEGKTNADGVHLVADPDDWQNTLKAKLAKGTEVHVLAKGNNWRKVEVRTGPHVGKIGWISNIFFQMK